MLALASPCLGGAVEDSGFRVEVGGAEPLTLGCAVLVNAAALGAQALARSLAGLDPSTIPPLHYAKGNYFSLSGRSPFARLIYPMPSDAWLGIHSSLDLGGRCRFGPDLSWVEHLDYDVDLPRAQGRRFGASQRFSVAPGDEANGIMHIPAGQSGHPLSDFYRKGHEDWASGSSSPFLPGDTQHKLLLSPAD